MVGAQRGAVVVSTSAAGLVPGTFGALYGASRAAAISLVRAAALEVAASGVTVNAIATAFLDAAIFREATGTDDPEKRRKLERKIPLGRYGDPAELAEFAAVLLEGRSGFQTGQCFSFSGGWSA